MKTRLTDRGLKALKPRAKPYDKMDTDATAFGVRVQPTGEVIFIMYRRFPGSTKPTRRKIGRYPDMSLAQARDVAHDWLGKIRRGIDPSAEEAQARKANIEAERARKANTVEAALKAYLASKSHLRTARAMKVELERELKPLMDRSIQDIRKGDVEELIHGIRARGAAGQARAIYSLVKSFFNWIVREDNFGIEASPCAKIQAETLAGRKQEVDRTLTDLELRAFWRATERLGYPAGSFFRLLLLSGLRRREASNASWQEFDLAAGRWIIPKARMKAAPGKARDHLVPVAGATRALLEALPRHAGGDFLFSYGGGASPICAFSKLKAALDAAMKDELAKEAAGMKDELAKKDATFKDFVIHDLRRTVRTRLSSLGVPGDICERVLAHAQPEIERRYNKYAFEAEKRAALETWHRALENIVKPRPDLRAVA